MFLAWRNSQQGMAPFVFGISKSLRNIASIWLVAASISTFMATGVSAGDDRSSWQRSIAAVEEFQTKLRSQLGRWQDLGTALNELDIPAHRCSILGRMLGKEAEIREIEVDYSNIGQSDYDLSVAIHSLDNWLLQARSLIGETRSAKIKMWNLNCVGQMGVSETAYIRNEGPDTFYRLGEDGRSLFVLGDVEEGFAEKLDAALSASPKVETVVLGSGGGFVIEALKAGFLIRERGLDTTLSDDCYSACTLVFLAGVERTIWSPYPRLGFHKVSAGGIAVDLYDESYDLIARYSQSMGVNSKAVLKAMIKAEPHDMHYPDFEYICAARITTWIQRHDFCP